MNAPSSRPPYRRPPPDLGTLLECVRRRWWLGVLLGCVLGGTGAAGAYLAIPTKFKATAMIRLSNAAGVIETPRESSTAQREFRTGQQDLLRMPHVLRRALESPKIRETGELDTDADAVDDLASWMEMELPRGSEVLRLSVRHKRADLAFLLTNAVTDAYLEEYARSNEEGFEKKLAVLERLTAESEERLTKGWDQLLQLAKELGSGDPTILSLQVQAEIESYRDYSRHLREVRSDKREAERQVRSILSSGELPTKTIAEDESQNSVRYAMYQAKVKYEKALTHGGPDHPEAVAAKTEEKMLNEYYAQNVKNAEKTAKPVDRKEEMLAEPRAKIARLENEERALETMIGEIDSRIATLGGDNASKLEILRNRIRRQEAQSDRLWKSRETIQVERHADQRVQLVAYASEPISRDTSKRNRMTVMAGGGGLGFGILLVAVAELLGGTVHSFREASKRTPVPFLVSLPRLPANAPQPGDTDPAMARLRSQLDVFVARLLHPTPEEEPRTFLVTSARWQRERLRVAAHVAASLARTGHKTILVNLDLREPEAPMDFFRPGQPTVAELVLSESGPGLCGASLATEVANLDYLAAGPSTDQPLPILAHPRLEKLLGELKQRYAYVVMEVAGALDYPDVVHVGRLADAVLLSAVRNRSTANGITEAYERLSQVGLPVFGTMIA